MQADGANKKVHFEIVAGLTAENAAWNFNGQAEGDMTITVPQGWAVTMTFSNQDGDVPHSLYFLAGGPPFPDELPDESAIPRAYSINLKNGIGAGKEDELRFTSGSPGKFAMACGVFGHARAGMWDWFVVSTEAELPSVEIGS
jgi:sulfocyanin